MTTSPIPTFSFRQVAARQFADRPTLRQVVNEQLLKVLLKELPWLAFVTPALPTAEPLMLDSPDPATGYWTTQPLVDRILQALVDPQPLSIEALEDKRHYNLALKDPYRFAGSDSAFDTRQLTGLSNALNALVARLPQLFCEAQLGYWKAGKGAGVSRDRWLQLLLKAALLRALPLQGLDEKEQACIRGLVSGGTEQPSVFFVNATLTHASQRYEEMLCHILILGEWDERQVVLWCAPSGIVRSFDSLTAFGEALRDELAQRYAFAQMSWQRYPVEGDVFALQASMLLECLFNRVDQARYSGLVDIAALEQRFAQISDPSSWFVDYENDTAAVMLPPGLRQGTAQNSFAWCAALLQIAIFQLESDGVAALDGIQSLHEYARQELSKRIDEDYQDQCSPDDLILDLYLARGVPGGAGTGAGGGEPLAFVGSKTLTEFAIGNLSSLKGASIGALRRRDGESVPHWLTADSAKKLVTDLDMGGRYPVYVANLLDDAGRRVERVKRLGREWRCALLSSAVTGKHEGKITEVGLQCVVDFCAGHLDPALPRMALFPLAFKRSPTSKVNDRVQAMYLLFCAEPSRVLLYRPLFKQDTVREYSSLTALLEHVQESQLLQDSIVEWMNPAVQAIYQGGGFQEPHIAVLGPDPFSLPDKPAPASLSVELWRNELDEKIYKANRKLLIELADQQSVSNAESRWQRLSEGAWLLFDVLTLALRGPVASVTWLVQLLVSLEKDLEALEQGDEFARSAAAADLMLNLLMTLLHARQPASVDVHPHELPNAMAFLGPAAQRGDYAEITVVPVEGPPVGPAALASHAERWLDLSWRGQHGFNWLPPEQRRLLKAMQSGVSLNGLSPLSSGEAMGLYLREGHHYATLSGDVYRVEVSAEGVRVVNLQGAPGPWLAFIDGAWRVDGTLRLAGGMPKHSTQSRLFRRFGELRDAVNAQKLAAETAQAQFAALSGEILELEPKLEALKAQREKTQAQQVALSEGDESKTKLQALVVQFDARIAQREKDIASKRDASVLKLELSVTADNATLPLLAIMKEPKFASLRQTGEWKASLSKTESSVRENLIRNTDFVITELTSLSQYSQLTDLQKILHGKELSKYPGLYNTFRRKLSIVVAFQERLLLAFERYDGILSDTPDEFEISGVTGEPPRTVGELIASRGYTTVQLRFYHVLNLADLALHLDDAAGKTVLKGYMDDLAGIGLRNANEAHGQLDFANLSAQDRITILQEAWDEYSAAILNSARIRNEGGVLVEPEMIDRYQEHVKRLKLDAGERLVEAVRELDDATAPRRRSPYAVSSAPQTLVRNAQGQLMIGTEVEVEGQRVLQVREMFSDTVLATFDQVDGQWRERQSKRPSLTDEAAPADLSMWVQSLLDEGVAVRAKATSYIENDIKGRLLVQLFDQQLERLSQATSVVSDGGGGDALIKSLEREADQLRAQKKLHLTTLYTDTSYPTAEALAFLHAEGLIAVEYIERRTMQDGSAFDEYKIQRLPSKRNLWAAHFHFSSADAFAEDFTAGHLKTWNQRRLSSRLAAVAGQRLHRGKLTLEQARGIIPFN